MELYEQPLSEADGDPDPLKQFAAWFADAAATGIRMPEACAVASATPGGAPSVRMVLLKSYDERGFVFFTNYASRKAGELDRNPRAAMMFYWDPLGRAVRIEGTVARTSAEESAAYVRSRPRASQLSAMASPQSEVIADRAELEAKVAALAAEYDGAELPVPAGWGGYRLTPASFEFWQNREDRLHDRLRYTPAPGAAWRIERLAP
jgi:pyridoxamine 5'-phosphate oxidase